jgi:Methyltransferase domain
VLTNEPQPIDRLFEDLKQAALQADVKDRVATFTGEILQMYIHSGEYRKYFQLWESFGVHVTPVHFYFPIPDTRQLPGTLWEKPSELPGVDLNERTQLELLTSFGQFRLECDSVPMEKQEDPGEFYFNNPFFSGTDALVLYCMIRHFQPAAVIEVGCGFSSRMIRRAVRKNQRGRVTCIDPFADGRLTEWFPEATVRKVPVQEVELSVFEALGAGDILFIDSSHVARIGSDVNYFFLEVIPRLQPGVIVHVHDIFLPMEMRKEWVLDELRFWTEQYLLQAFLAFNRQFEVLMANGYLGLKHPDALQATFPHSPWWGGGSFWMRRLGSPVGEPASGELCEASQ